MGRLHQLLQAPDSDLLRVLTHFQVDSARLAKDLTESLDRLPRGASAVSDLSTQVEDSVERGWVYGSLMFAESEVRSGHLLVGWLKTHQLKNALFAISGRDPEAALPPGMQPQLGAMPERPAVGCPTSTIGGATPWRRS